ncbi:2854_t:CDS:2, partial [Gigaspora margarita]
CIEVPDLTTYNLKSIVGMIIDSIKEGPHMSTCYENVSTFYFACSQLNELAYDYKKSNRKRTIRFDCYGKLNIHIDIPVAKVVVKLSHGIFYNALIDCTTPAKIKLKIEKNLHMSPIQL